MTIAAEYAKALYDLVEKNEKEGNMYLKNLRQALERRGHIKLLPQIFSEYKKLAMGRERAELHGKITPENERTRALLELYRKMTATDETANSK
jgi:F0F1-type ATP synthase delta subunit